MRKIEFGDKVRCKHTGFEGVALARTEFFNGCVQWEVQPPYDKKAKKIVESTGIDEQSLVIVKKASKPRKKRETGGANRTPTTMKGY